MPQLEYVDPNHPRSAFSRAYAAFSGTRLGRLISTKIVWKLDPYLLRATRGTTCASQPWATSA